MNKSVYLKIKVKSLAEEAKIIRREERKCKDEDLRNGLTLHRKRVVRPEARATLVAYGYLRGRSYHVIEPKTDTSPDWDKVRSMVSRYGETGVEARKTFDAWMKAGAA